MRFFNVLIFALSLAISATAVSAETGKFVGEIIAALADDGRNLILKEPFGYVDPKGKSWDVPAGTETDGASVPKAFWLAYPPFTGKYRRAAVIHDYYCQTQERSWQDTHNVFFDAMLDAGVDLKTAKVMWAAVYYMGPRWLNGGARRSLSASGPRVKDEATQKDVINKLEAWVARDNPDQETIKAALRAETFPKRISGRSPKTSLLPRPSAP